MTRHVCSFDETLRNVVRQYKLVYDVTLKEFNFYEGQCVGSSITWAWS